MYHIKSISIDKSLEIFRSKGNKMIYYKRNDMVAPLPHSTKDVSTYPTPYIFFRPTKKYIVLRKEFAHVDTATISHAITQKKTNRKAN